MKVIITLLLSVVVVYGAETCLRACQMDYKPVCATFTKTYGNACSMKADACEMAKKGYSLLNKATESECSCERACSKILLPVCANDGNTYNNECLLGSESCRQRKFLEKVSDGACKPQV